MASQTARALLLGMCVIATLSVTTQAESEGALFHDEVASDGSCNMPDTIHQQRALLATAAGPAYGPTHAPTYSPKPSPTPSPKKPCKFASTPNVNYYSVTIRSPKNWGAGRDAIVKAAATVYRSYSQSKLKVKVTGAGGQEPQEPTYDFTYLVEVPVTPCVGFKEGMRNKLRTAIKKVKFTGVQVVGFTIVS